MGCTEQAMSVERMKIWKKKKKSFPLREERKLNIN